AKVYVSIMQEPLRKPVMELLTQHQSYIRKKLALKVGKQLRVVPELHFYIDDSLDYALHIDTLLKK
ncbi:MAG: ribosome-binding factor A, partial [Bacteroidia bacterium]